MAAVLGREGPAECREHLPSSSWPSFGWFGRPNTNEDNFIDKKKLTKEPNLDLNGGAFRAIRYYVTL